MVDPPASSSSSECEQFYTTGRVPDSGNAIAAAGDNPAAIRRKSRRDTPSCQREQVFASCRLPNLRSSSIDGENPAAVRGKSDRTDEIGPLQRKQLLAAERIPHFR